MKNKKIHQKMKKKKKGKKERKREIIFCVCENYAQNVRENWKFIVRK